MRRLFIITAAAGAAAALLAGAALDRMDLSEWRRIQRDYNESRGQAGLSPVPIGIRAIRPAPHRQPERCVTCHLGMALPPAGRFKAHSPLPCVTPDRVGCTACHRGQGRRLTAAGAHGLGPDAGAHRLLGWGAKDQRRRRLQAGCAGCHQERGGVLRYDARVVPDVADGLNLFLARGCNACHRLRGVHCPTDVGPRLTGVGGRRSRDQLLKSLRDPQGQNPSSPMPTQMLSTRERDRLVLLLQAQHGHTVPARRPPPRLLDHLGEPGGPVGPATGARLARRAGCLGCHRLAEADGGALDLRHVGWTSTEKELRQALVEPQKRFPGTRMPRLELPDELVESVVQYLSLQRVPLPSSPGAVLAKVCDRCHGPKRDPGWVVFVRSPPLLHRRPPPRDALVKAAHGGRSGTAMAQWGKVLTRDFLGQIHRALAQGAR